ncbi:hypothetical protein DPMN_091698 [Dreissena polymorpha]|uniref:Uncharacterized protein n=1 Tax=Dreissena polymorpha TaxID=45954 RepID=A0A9D4QZH0_DREPO|nr:hypothetical protein DPMN_091698 [Dreissena polymorpha]
MSKFHEDWKTNVSSTLKKILPGGHVFFTDPNHYRTPLSYPGVVVRSPSLTQMNRSQDAKDVNGNVIFPPDAINHRITDDFRALFLAAASASGCEITRMRQ